jgi:MFS superfamily sulfate permease-like transporter
LSYLYIYLLIHTYSLLLTVSALFGGFGGCGLIPNTLLNGTSGGEGYASSFAYSLFLALFVVVFAPIIGKIPMASLAGKNEWWWEL